MSRSTHLTPLAIRTIKVRVELVARGISTQRDCPPLRALCTQGMRSRTKRGMKEVRLRLARLSLLVPLLRPQAREPACPRISRERMLILTTLAADMQTQYASLPAFVHAGTVQLGVARFPSAASCQMACKYHAA